MKKFVLPVLLAVCLPCLAIAQDAKPFLGRWDMTVTPATGAPYPQWMELTESGGNSTIVYFVTDDCAVEASRVEAAGGKIMKPKFAIGAYGFIALAFDTEGNVFGLHSMK